MFKRKSFVSLVIGVVFVFGLSLAGCGKNAASGNGEGETIGNNTTAQATAETIVGLPEAKISWYYPGSEPLGDEQEVYAAVNKLIKDQINATVEFNAIAWAEYQEKMKIMMAAAEEFDICFTSNWFNNYQLAASKGSYLPLEELLKNYAPKLLASMKESIWNATKLNGKIYGVPNQQIFARSSNMEIPKEFADKYGLDYQNIGRDYELESLEPYLEAFTKAEPDKYATTGDYWTRGDHLGYYNMEVIGGGDVPGAIYLDDENLKVFNQFKSEQYKQFLALMQKWKEKGYLKSKELLNNKGKIAVGTDCGSWFGGTWKPGVEAEASQTYGREMIERPISESILNNSGVLATLDAISRTSENPERTMMLLELINNDETIFNLITWGIEGKHYNKKEGKYIEPIKDTKYAVVPSWLLATTFRSYLLVGQPEDVWEQTKKVNEEAKPSPALGFTFDPTIVKTEVANCTAVIKEYDDGLSMAILSLDKDYPQFIEKLEKAGSDKIIEEMQKQIDAWITAK